MFDPSAKLYASVIFCAALIVIATAWGFQIIGGYIPCALCLEQRLGYYAALTILAVLIVSYSQIGTRFSSSALKLFLCVGFSLSTLSFLWSGALGVWQAGAEWGFWQGPIDCGGSGLPQTTINDGFNLMESMTDARLIACDEASWRFLGLSFAGWNIVSAFGLACLSLCSAWLSYRKYSNPSI